MHKLLAALLIGVFAGSLATYFLLPDESATRFSEPPERDIRDVPEISAAEAEMHREDRYASIRTIEDTLALPSDFAETEALYVIAGRADSNEVQNLLHQAARIRDRSDRKAALAILFLRLTEMDPQSALAIARTPTFNGDKSHEKAVWIAWGRLDLDAALAAAEDGDTAQKNRAAQALYSSLRSFDDEKSNRIQSVLEVRPGRSARAQRLYALADESPVAAIRYIESMPSVSDRREHFAWLGYHLSRTGAAEQSDYAELIQSSAGRQQFQQALDSYDSRSDPEAALRKVLSRPMNNQRRSLAYTALHQLAKTSPEKAFEYLDQLTDPSMKRDLGMVVATALAGSDPHKALAWAREQDTSGNQQLLQTVVAQIAQHDPQLALSEAQTIANKQARDQAISSVIASVAQNDPSQAVQMLEVIADPDSRTATLNQLASTWAQSDFDAAVDWVSSLDADEQRGALQQMGQNLVYANVDRAIELVQRFPAADSRRLKIQIAQNLAQKRTVEAAQAFINQFKGTDDYSKLQVTVISSAANTDPARAMQLAKSIQNIEDRDQVYAAVVGQQAMRDPRKALQWLESISGDQARSRAVMQIAHGWYSQDAAAAEAWLHSLPRGAVRDDAIVATMSMRQASAADPTSLIDSIGDPAKRKQALLMRVQMLARTNPAEAERVLNSIDISDAERSQYRKMLEGVHFMYD